MYVISATPCLCYIRTMVLTQKLTLFYITVSRDDLLGTCESELTLSHTLDLCADTNLSHFQSPLQALRAEHSMATWR